MAFIHELWLRSWTPSGVLPVICLRKFLG
jgi:hypothetical protein